MDEDLEGTAERLYGWTGDDDAVDDVPVAS